MTELTKILNRFNRKERNLLVRDILDYSPGNNLPLSEDFRARVDQALNIVISAKAW